MVKKTTPTGPPTSLNLPKENKRSNQGKSAKKKFSDGDTPDVSGVKVPSLPSPKEEEVSELSQEEPSVAVKEDARRGEGSLLVREEEEEEQVGVALLWEGRGFSMFVCAYAGEWACGGRGEEQMEEEDPGEGERKDELRALERSV